MTTLSYHIHHCLEQYQTMYEQMAICVDPVDLPEIFDDMNVNNIGRGIAFLTYVYVLKGSEDVTRRAVRLVATVLKDMALNRVFSKECFLGSEACLHYQTTRTETCKIYYNRCTHILNRNCLRT